MEIKDIKDINDEIIKVWKKYGKVERGPLVPMQFSEKEFKKNVDVLFIGMNPSYVEKDLKAAWEEKKSKKEFKTDFSYEFSTIDDEEHLKEIIALDADKPNNRFFDKIRSIFEESQFDSLKDRSWEMIDLFFIRKTEATDVTTMIYKNGKENKGLNYWAEEQIKIVKDLVKLANPKVIVVINAVSTKILKNEILGEDKDKGPKSDKFNYEIGTYETDYFGTEKGCIPIFFSGQLKYEARPSFERFCWQLSRCFAK